MGPVELWRTCEHIRDELRDAVGLSTLVVDIQAPKKPITIRLEGASDREESVPDPRYAWMRPVAPASMRVPLRDATTVIGSLTVLHAGRAFYPARALVDLERIAAHYAPTFRNWIETPER